MRRIAPMIALILAVLAGGAAAETNSNAPWTMPQAAPGHSWVGAIVYDREGVLVGPIQHVASSRSGARAVIVLWGHQAWTPMKTLTMKPDGTVVSTMRRYEIFLTYPGCELC